MNQSGKTYITNVFGKWGWYVKDNGDTLQFKNPKWKNYYSCNVQDNLDEYGSFQVYKEWLTAGQDRVFHVNPRTQWVTWYSVEDMLNVFNNMSAEGTNQDSITITNRYRPSFVQSRKVLV